MTPDATGLRDGSEPRDAPTSTRRSALRTGALLGVGGLAGCALAPGTTTETVALSLDARDAETITVAAGRGDVTLAGEAAQAVTGTATKRSSRNGLEQVSVERSVQDGHVTVAVESADADGSGPPDGTAVDLDLTVPDYLSVTSAETTIGAVTVSGLSVGHAPEKMGAFVGTVTTEHGDVDLRDVDGPVHVESTNGDLTLRGVTGLGFALTDNGDVDLSIREMDGDAVLRSTRGDVTATVPDDLGATVEMGTTNGTVSVGDVPLSVETATETRIRGRLAAGGPSLVLETTNGDVALEST